MVNSTVRSSQRLAKAREAQKAKEEGEAEDVNEPAKDASDAGRAQPTRRCYSLAFKAKVVRYATRHNNCQASRKFGVPRQCIQNWKITLAMRNVANSLRKRLPGGGRKIQDRELERKMVEWIQGRRRAGARITANMVKSRARSISPNRRFKASNGWFEAFKKRHPMLFQHIEEQVGQPEANEAAEEEDDLGAGGGAEEGEGENGDDGADGEAAPGENEGENGANGANGEAAAEEIEGEDGVNGEAEDGEEPEVNQVVEMVVDQEEGENPEDPEDLADAAIHFDEPNFDDFDFDDFEENRIGVNEIEAMDEIMEDGMDDVAHPIDDLAGDRMEVDGVIQEKEQEEEEGQEEAQGQAEKNKTPTVNVAPTSRTIIVLCAGGTPRGHHSPSSTNSISYVKKYDAQIPASCVKAIDGDKNGSFELASKFPGVPAKKFAEQGGDYDATCPVQVAFEKSGSKGVWVVYLEGSIMKWERTERQLEGSLALVNGKNLARFLKNIEDTGSREMGQAAHTWRFTQHNEEHNSLFWNYQHISYFHSKVQYEAGLGPVTYIGLTGQLAPNFSYITANLITRDVFEKCVENLQNPASEILKGRILSGGQTGGCENPNGCVCNDIKKALYPGSQYMEYDQDGLLNMESLDQSWRRIAIECSDACGCSSSCPRRQLQRGQTKPFFVTQEGVKGFGLRAGDQLDVGELIGEYAGVLKHPGINDDRSYEAEVSVMSENLVICSKDSGNLTRFMSHSCDPSAVFVEVHSRSSESELLLPRIAVYAIKKIEFGDEITISYTQQHILENIKNWPDHTKYPCLCGSPKCYGSLPKP